MINQLAAQSPDHPLVALFQPLVEKNTEFLEQNVAKYYNRIKMFPTDSRSKSKLLDVFVDWLLQRFNDRGKLEIERMLLGELPDLQETQAGKDLIAIGMEKGIEKGIEKGELIGTIRTCQSILGSDRHSNKVLLAKSIEELSRIALELQTNLRKRFGAG